MNFLSPILHHALSHRLGWALIHSLWQGAFIGVAYALLGIALRRHSARARYLAGCLGLALLAASPVVTFMLSSDEAQRPAERAVGGTALLQSTFSPEPSSAVTPPRANALPAWLFSAAARISELTPWLALAWATGVVVFAARLSRGLWWLRMLQVTGNEPIL